MEQRDKWLIVGERGQGRGGGFGLPVVHFHYRIGLGPHLFRSKSVPPQRGGLLGMELGKYDGRGNPEPFCGEVLRECQARRFSGVVCRLGERRLPGLGEILARLAESCHSRGLSCFVPEQYGQMAAAAGVLIPTAISGGSLERRLKGAVREFGAERVAIWLNRGMEDFTLPAPSGSGRQLGYEELESLREKYRASCFFSDALCARYFTYMDGMEGHFVLFDDLASLQKKLNLAGQLGIRTVFFPTAELGELTGELLRERKSG